MIYSVGLASSSEYEEIFGYMAKTKKRRVQKARPHQSMKSGDGKSGVNWTRILLIVIGVVIVMSMLLSLVNFNY